MSVDFRLAKQRVHALVGDTHPIELTFQLPTDDAFKTVNAAVFYTLNRLSINGTIRPDSVDGATLYRLNLAGKPAQLYVLHILPRAAALRFHWLRPADPIQRLVVSHQQENPDASTIAAHLIEGIEAAITELLRSTVIYEGQVPPPPPKTDLAGILRWANIYYPDWTDQELANTVGIAHSTIANQRKALQMPKRTARGKSRFKKK